MVTVVPSRRKAACGGVGTEQNSAGTWRDRDCTAEAGSCPSPASVGPGPQGCRGHVLAPRVPCPPAPAHSHSRSADGAPLQPWVAAHIPATSGLHRSVRILTETRADVSDVSLRLCFLRNAALPEGNGSRFLELEMAGVITSAPSEQPPGSL